jgi:tripartite-type tricarboxylate transporter receptor subunit TctC
MDDVVAPAGATDSTARLIGQWLSKRLGQQFVIENRPGGGGNIGTETVVKAAPDGYTLLLIQTSNAINATLYDKLNFNFIRDVAPVARIAHTPLVVVVHPSVPVRTVPELIAYAKANPGKLNMGAGGIGGISSMAGELFKVMTGVNMVLVPYRGGAPAVADLLGGQLQVMFNVTPESIEYIRAGKLRALAVTSISRSDALPDLPIVADFVPGFEASYWAGLGAPRNMPAEIIGKLSKEINAALAAPGAEARDDEAALERLSRRHQGPDHQPRGTPATANYPGVDAGARDIQVFQEVCVARWTALKTRSSLPACRARREGPCPST